MKLKKLSTKLKENTKYPKNQLLIKSLALIL